MRYLTTNPATIGSLACYFLLGSLGWYQTASADTPVPRANSEADASREEDQGAEIREQRLANYLTGATFTGNFTVEGNEDRTPKPESYRIKSCEKLDQENMYRLTVAIRYGDTDGEFPMDLPILWSGKTPVITLDSVWIPGLGTFSARVLLHKGRYAGTWQHDEKGGHLFGTITPAPKDDKAAD